ncbi:MAG: hypothetical protein IJS50_02790 [Desulfovibrio sp.]|nr:hypothetical protein [Desulfovibrio sp.]
MSPAYTEKLEAYARQKAKDALVHGQSFVAPISEEMAKEKLPLPRPPLAQQEPKETQEAKSQKEPSESVPQVMPRPPLRATKGPKPARVQELVQALQRSLAQNREQPRPQAILSLNAPSAKPWPRAEEKVSEKNASPKLKAGDLLLAVNCVSLNSDAPGPALVEVVDGPLTGAKLFGKFSLNQEHLTLTFHKLLTPEGLSLAVLAYAVDPKTQATALASKVNHHYFERFAGLMAGSFLQGFGDAVRHSGQRTYHSVYGASTSLPSYDLGQEALIALGKVGERTANLLQDNFRRRPTVILEAGLDLGVLILEVSPLKKAEKPS